MRTVPFFALVLGLFGLVATSPLAEGQDPPKGPPPKPQIIYGQFRDLMNEGKYDIAANFLQAFLESNPADADLLEIERRFGTTAFSGLRSVPRWSDDPATEKKARANVEEAVKKAKAASEKLLHDPARVQKYIRNLGATYEERVFAEQELKRTGDFAVPFMVEEFRNARDKDIYAGILGAIPKMEPQTMAGWLAALDGFTPDQQYGVLRAIASRDDSLVLQGHAQTDITPTLWRILSLPAEANPTLQAFAGDLLTKLRPGIRPATKLPEAELVAVARPFYEHTARFAGTKNNADSPSTVPMWVWDTTNPMNPLLKKIEEVPLGQAEEFYGLRYARWALEKKPDYEPAQGLVLALAAERAIERAKFGNLAKAEPAVFKLLSDAPPQVLTDLLSRGLLQKRTGLSLAMIQVLGERGEKSATQLMVKALTYPDPQVQIAAANALLRSPTPVPPEVRGKVVEVLRRAAAADPGVPGNAMGTALLADPNKFRADNTAVLLRGLGYNVEVFTTGRDLLRRVAHASDFDVILIDHHAPNPELIDLVGQLHSAPQQAANRPTLVLASTDKPRVPTFDQLLVRAAALIAATELDAVNMPSPFVPDSRFTPDENAINRRKSQELRDGQFRHTAAERMGRLHRLIETTGIRLTDTQKLLMNLRIELITYAVLGADFPISPLSAPGTADHLVKLRRQIDLQPPSPAYGAGTPTTDILKMLERFETDLKRVPPRLKQFEELYAKIDAAELGLPVETFRDPVLEARLIRLFRNYPAVRVIPEPYGRTTLAADLQAVQAEPGAAPYSQADKTAAQVLAVEWLRKMATGEVAGFEVKSAEPELRAALRVDSLAEAAIDGVSRFGSADVQRSLVELALNAGRPTPIRTKAADAAIRHVQVNGRGLAKPTLDALAATIDVEPDAALRGKLLILGGLLIDKPAIVADPSGKPIPNPGAYVNQLKGYNPPIIPVPPKLPEPNKEPEKEPEKKP